MTLETVQEMMALIAKRLLAMTADERRIACEDGILDWKYLEGFPEEWGTR